MSHALWAHQHAAKSLVFVTLGIFKVSEFGPVAAVNVPRRVLDSSDAQRTMFAFVVMKTREGARNAFTATRKVCFSEFERNITEILVLNNFLRSCGEL